MKLLFAILIVFTSVFATIQGGCFGPSVSSNASKLFNCRNKVEYSMKKTYFHNYRDLRSNRWQTTSFG